MIKSMRVPRALVWVVVLPLCGCGYFFQLDVDGHRFQEALRLQRQGEQDRALAIYRSLEPEQRRYPGVLNNLGVIYARQGRLDLADAALTKASELEQDEVVIWANLGIVRFLRHRLPEALHALEQVAPAGDRQLVRAVDPGRVDWRYRPVQQKVRRAVTVANQYLARLGQDVQDAGRPRRVALLDEQLASLSDAY
jgi:tetratricopeptide (TPR) repeat protein